jgi:hypothetical protein
MWGEEITMSGADRSHTKADRGIEAGGGVRCDIQKQRGWVWSGSVEV